MDLKDLDLKHWWKMLAAAGALIAIASAPAKFTAGFLIGLGLLLFGAGEWKGHPELQRQVPARFGVPSAIQSIWPRQWSVLGVGLDIAGLVCFAVGMGRLLAGA